MSELCMSESRKRANRLILRRRSTRSSLGEAEIKFEERRSERSGKAEKAEKRKKRKSKKSQKTRWRSRKSSQGVAQKLL
eukprot:scaffold8485_cov277-Pinguiococcus_pyrenoidosus.AAC.7